MLHVVEEWKKSCEIQNEEESALNIEYSALLFSIKLLDQTKENANGIPSDGLIQLSKDLAHSFALPWYTYLILLAFYYSISSVPKFEVRAIRRTPFFLPSL